jgi:NAD(P)-dependent dehydrogenase (short-subunit alcohol dehydrogenase family)
MGILSAIPVIGEVVEKGLGVVDKFVEDKDQANRLKAEIKQQIEAQTHERDITKLQAQASIIKAEATGESAEQRKWRPHLMYVIMGILVFNAAIVPVGEAVFQVDIPTLEAWQAIPPQMWQLLMIGMGGYIGGRTAEKIFRGRKK